MKQSTAHMCASCGKYLPRALRQYGELSGGWAREHEGGGAHSILNPLWTGRVLCELCFDKQRPEGRAPAKLRDICDDCGTAPVTLRQIANGWTRLQKLNAVLDPRYSALALCDACFIERMRGEQMTLFDA